MQPIWSREVVPTIQLQDFLDRAWYKKTWFVFDLPEKVFKNLPTGERMLISEIPDVGYVIASIDCKVLWSETPCVLEVGTIDTKVYAGKIGMLTKEEESNGPKSA